MTFLSKIITFLMLPLYTGFLTTEEYGVISMITTTSELVVPVLTVCAHEGLFRFMYDVEVSKADAWKVATYLFWRGILLCVIGITILGFFKIIQMEYLIYFFSFSVVSGFFQLLSFYYRGLNRTNIMLETNVACAFFNCLFSIVLIVKYRLGLEGYFISQILGYIVSIIWGCFRVKLKGIIYIQVDKEIRKKIQKYSIPLIVTSIGWWIGNFIDRYVVTYFLGTSANGIYSVSYKIPTIISLLAMIMNRAWTLSVLNQNELQSSEKFMSKLYEMYNSVLILGSAFIILINIPLAKILYANKFYEAWKYTGPLVLSATFITLSNFYDAIFLKEKDTKSTAIVSVIVAVSNAILSLLLVQISGIMGVAIGTLISNIAGYIIKIKKSRIYIQLDVSYIKHGILYVVLIIQVIIGLQEWNRINDFLSAVIFGGLCISLKNYIFIILNEMKTIVKKAVGVL